MKRYVKQIKKTASTNIESNDTIVLPDGNIIGKQYLVA